MEVEHKHSTGDGTSGATVFPPPRRPTRAGQPYVARLRDCRAAHGGVQGILQRTLKVLCVPTHTRDSLSRLRPANARRIVSRTLSLRRVTPTLSRSNKGIEQRYAGCLSHL